VTHAAGNAMIVRRSALVERPAAHMFDLIEAAEHYPHFLPWCAAAQIVHRDDTMVSADLRVKWGGMQFEMRTRNPKRRPESMTVHLERGPFSRFEGEWTLRPLGLDACKIEFLLDYEFNSAVMTRVAGPVFNHLADSMVDAFVQHAMRTQVTAPLPPATDI
jgi:ribosome-associated toxin RatA of RatAB toxin-antitoxin module